MCHGACSCDEIRYCVEGEPLFTHACHCMDCQRRSGSAFSLSTFLGDDQLRVIGGVPAMHSGTGKSGARKQVYYCIACGTMLYGRNLGSPRVLWLRPGTLNDTSWIRPQAHVWTRSKQPWVVLSDDVPIFETGYEIGETWPARSLERLASLR